MSVVELGECKLILAKKKFHKSQLLAARIVTNL